MKEWTRMTPTLVSESVCEGDREVCSEEVNCQDSFAVQVFYCWPGR